MSGKRRGSSLIGVMIIPQALCLRQAENVIFRDGGALPT
jgi:hypothetical protein